MVLVRKMKKLAKQCFSGDLTLPKVIFWLVGINCMLAGIVFGLCIAPLTHGITIGSNNGNSNYDKCKWGFEEKEDNEEENEE